MAKYLERDGWVYIGELRWRKGKLELKVDEMSRNRFVMSSISTIEEEGKEKQ